jgi:hypothetical protein
MDELLARVLDAHGGLERWSGLEALTARLSVGGPFWGLRGFPDAFLDERLELYLHREHAAFTPWIAPGQRLTFDVAPERVTLLTADGNTVDSRTNPRSSYAGYNRYSAWDALQVGYFLSYAMWNYLTTPYLFTYPGVQTREVEPWDEDGETWRRLHVTFPDTIATHTAEQDFYYDSDAMLRRHDYTVDVNANAVVAHYADEYKTFDGLVFPTRRRVHRRNPDGTPDRSQTAITIDIYEIAVR